MRVELRSDGLHISGYVNVPGRQSRPVMTPHGMVIETIEQRAFQRAIERAGNIRMLLDHDPERVLADTASNTLQVAEDNIGLRAESVVTDPEVIEGARTGKLRGWSFNIKNPVDEVEQRAEGLPLRIIKDLEMDEVTLVMHRIPVYSSTSIEVRADTDDGERIEYRAGDEPVEFVDMTEKDPDPEEERAEEPKEPEQHQDYHADVKRRIEDLKYTPVQKK